MKNKKIMISICFILFVILIICIFFLVIKKNSKNNKNYDWYEVYSVSSFMSNEYSNILITSKQEFDKYIEDYSKSLNLLFDKYDYLLIKLQVDNCRENINGIKKVEYSNDILNINIGYNANCGFCAVEDKYYLIPFDKNTINNYVDIEYNFIQENKENCNTIINNEIDVVYKPIIYLYPKEDTNVLVKLGYPNNLIVSYPKYNDGWNVYAKTNGDLIDLKNNRTYYGLYWEGLNNSSNSIRDVGFIVKGEGSATFLEEKLAILGLNEREANEFIIYWLPKLENNKYNYIYFETIDEINKNMPLYISPMPDKIIRIVMEFKPLDKPINIKEQKLENISRNGFTVVEWGGTELK